MFETPKRNRVCWFDRRRARKEKKFFGSQQVAVSSKELNCNLPSSVKKDGCARKDAKQQQKCLSGNPSLNHVRLPQMVRVRARVGAPLPAKFPCLARLSEIHTMH